MWHDRTFEIQNEYDESLVRIPQITEDCKSTALGPCAPWLPRWKAGLGRNNEALYML